MVHNELFIFSFGDRPRILFLVTFTVHFTHIHSNQPSFVLHIYKLHVCDSRLILFQSISWFYNNKLYNGSACCRTHTHRFDHFFDSRNKWRCEIRCEAILFLLSSDLVEFWSECFSIPKMNSKDFTCDRCKGKQFADKGQLIRHFRINHMRLNFACGKCFQQHFSHTAFLNHRQKCHYGSPAVNVIKKKNSVTAKHETKPDTKVKVGRNHSVCQKENSSSQTATRRNFDEMQENEPTVNICHLCLRFIFSISFFL